MGDEALETATDDTFVLDSQESTAESTEANQNVAAPEGAAQAEPVKVVFDEAQQKVFDTAIAKKGLQNKRAEMASQTAIGELNQKIANLQTQLPQSIKPTIPELPDQFDDDFQTKMAARDQAIQEAAAFDANQLTTQQLQATQALATQQTQQQAANELATSFVGKAESLGVSSAELTTALDTVGAYGGIGQDLSNFVMGHDQGPLVAKYLAENPAEVVTIQSLTPLQGVAHLMSNVLPEAIANKQSTGAPAPVDGLSGNGTTVSDEGPAGATYE